MRCSLANDGSPATVRPMREFLILAMHLPVPLVRLFRPGGVRAVAAESLLLKHQLLISNRSRRRATNLTTLDRVVLGLTTLFVSSRRMPKLGALIKPATLFKFHKALVDRKYRLLFSSLSHCRKPGPKGPSPDLIAAIGEMKRRNPHSAACESLSRWLMPSASRSRRMSCAASLPDTTGQATPEPIAPLG